MPDTNVPNQPAPDPQPAMPAPPIDDPNRLEPGASSPAPQQAPDYTLTQSLDYFAGGDFDKDVAAFQACASLMTGYKTLDRIQPFYPGFYCVGAISSLGKTTFAIQLSDQVAAAGQFVLYFSLEQNRLELFSKSLARGFYRTHRIDARKNSRPSTYPTPTSMDIRRGLTSGYPAEMAQQIDAYTQAVQNRIRVIHGPFSVTVEDIVAQTNLFIQQTGVKPVVIVDYLQIIAPTLMNGRIPDTKTSIDHIVHTLKAMQSDLDLAVLAISSLNRQNYLTPVDFESFKESGGIEYTADVIWGLQLAILNDKTFYHHFDNAGNQKRETNTAERRKMINQAKLAAPRAIELVCLKNRYGKSNYTVGFQYYPMHDYFAAPYDPNDPDTWD